LESASTPVDHDVLIAAAGNTCAAYARADNATWRDHPVMRLSEDNTILCYDGPIERGSDVGLLKKLQDHGFFVIRSAGGDFPNALKIADLLLVKNATVVIYDYCLSACANYIFVASKETYVFKDSIVAWHGGPSQSYCSRVAQVISAERSRRRDQIQDAWEDYCASTEYIYGFFKRRNIDGRFSFAPLSLHTRKMFDAAFAASGNPNIFWMLNPANFGRNFNSSVTFEAYPRSQSEVDEILARLRLEFIRVIYDPEQ
jgi:hypothetical protein